MAKIERKEEAMAENAVTLAEKLVAYRGRLFVGIDLGTTNSGVSTWRQMDGAATGRIEILPNDQGRPLTPSVVGRDPESGKWLVGEAAEELAERHPETVARSFKRLIGRWFHDPEVRNEEKRLTYAIESGGGEDKLQDVVVNFGDDAGDPMRLSVPKVSSRLLRKLRKDAATSLGLQEDSVCNVVITVPAYFNSLQRRATILAGSEAGFTTVEIINEPTAAALDRKSVV